MLNLGLRQTCSMWKNTLKTVVVFTSTEVGAASETRSKKLYAILSGLLLHRPFKMLKQIAENNGLEVSRQLTSVYTPKT